ncbi:MAG: hypothetical protein PHP42_02705 [Bacteroidota bacterium]|nr:hypothetical protein [Bacteroidota bacterium]
MKSLYTKILFGILFLLGISVAQQQQRSEQMVQRLKDSLSLSDQQVTKIKVILDKQREEGRKDWEAHQGDRDAMRSAMMKRMEKSDVEIEKLLTKEQKKKYEEIKKHRREMMQERMKEQ